MPNSFLIRVILWSVLSFSFDIDRQQLREKFPQGRFIEVHVDCPLEVCKQRDPKGLYAKVARGEIQISQV